MECPIRKGLSTVKLFPFLAFILASTTVVGFLAPSVHVAHSATTHVRSSPWSRSLHSALTASSGRDRHVQIDRQRGVCRRARSAAFRMEVEPHVLRLQAAELGSRLKGTNVFFVGMMGTGKSTVARALADVMGRYIFLDTDTTIEMLLKASVGEIFATDGEEAFRSVESTVLDQAHSYVKMCIATGGGIVTEPKNWGKMQTGMVVWLDMEPQDIVARLTANPDEVAKRPLLAGDDPRAKVEEIMEKRRPQYEQADVVVKLEADDGIDDVTLNVVNSLLGFIDSNPPKWQQWKEKARQAGVDWA